MSRNRKEEGEEGEEQDASVSIQDHVEPKSDRNYPFSTPPATSNKGTSPKLKRDKNGPGTPARGVGHDPIGEGTVNQSQRQ